jgi:hypothetical protein
LVAAICRLADGLPLAIGPPASTPPALPSPGPSGWRTGRRLEMAAEIVVDLAFSWSLRGQCARGREWALQVSDALDQPSCQLLWATAFLSVYSGEMESGVQLAMSAVEQAQVTGDAATQGRALILIGIAQAFIDPAGAEPLLTTAAELASAAGDDWAVE